MTDGRRNTEQRQDRLESHMNRKAQKKANEKSENEALNTSISAIYQKYGTDLAAFYRDVRDDMVKAHQTSDSRQPCK